MSPDRDDKTGRYVREYPQEDFIEAIESLDTATTMRVTEFVGCSRNLAFRRLMELYKEDEITRDEIGGTYVWDR